MAGAISDRLSSTLNDKGKKLKSQTRRKKKTINQPTKYRMNNTVTMLLLFSTVKSLALTCDIDDVWNIMHKLHMRMKSSKAAVNETQFVLRPYYGSNL